MWFYSSSSSSLSVHCVGAQEEIFQWSYKMTSYAKNEVIYLCRFDPLFLNFIALSPLSEWSQSWKDVCTSRAASYIRRKIYFSAMLFPVCWFHQQPENWFFPPPPPLRQPGEMVNALHSKIKILPWEGSVLDGWREVDNTNKTECLIPAVGKKRMKRRHQ